MIMLNFLFRFLIQIFFILSIIQPNYGVCSGSKLDPIKQVILENTQNRPFWTVKVREGLIKAVGGRNLDRFFSLLKPKEINTFKITPVDVFRFMASLYRTKNDGDSDTRDLYIAQKLSFLMLQTDLLDKHNYTLAQSIGCSFIICHIGKEYYYKTLASILNESFKFLKNLNINSAYLEDIKHYSYHHGNPIDLISLPMFSHINKIFLSKKTSSNYLEGSEFEETFTKEYFSDLESPNFSILNNSILNHLGMATIAQNLTDLITETNLFYAQYNRYFYDKNISMVLMYYKNLDTEQRKWFLKIFLQSMSSLKISQNFSSFIEEEIASPSFSLEGYLTLYSFTIHKISPDYPETSPIGYTSHNYLINWTFFYFAANYSDDYEF